MNYVPIFIENSTMLQINHDVLLLNHVQVDRINQRALYNHHNRDQVELPLLSVLIQ
jgi:hypothetical protein